MAPTDALVMDDRRFRRFSLVLSAAAVLHAAVYMPLVASHVGRDSPTYIAAANALLEAGYTTPLQAGFFYEVRNGAVVDITGLEIDRALWTAPERQIFRPPGYPLFLAVFGGGDEGASRTLALAAQAALLGACAFLLALTVRRWWGPRIAVAATAVFAADPWSKRYATLILSEVVACFAALLLAYAFTRAWQERAARWWAVAGGAAAGLTLVRVAFVPAVVLVVLAALLRGPRARAAAAATAAGVLLLVPWLAWTHSVAGTPLLASYGEGFNLLLAAHGEGLERTQARVMDDPEFRTDEHAAQSLAPPGDVFARDPEAHPRYVVAADRELRERALERFGDRLAVEPARVAWETVYRAYFLWNAHEDWYQPADDWLLVLRIVDWLTLLLAVVGAAIAVRRRGAPAAVVVFIVVYTLAIALHHVEARFAMPLRPLFLAFATFAATTALGARLQPETTLSTSFR